MGAEIVEVSLPHTEYGIAAYYVHRALRSVEQPRPI